MRNMAGLQWMIGALVAGCNSNNDSSTPSPAPKTSSFLGDGMAQHPDRAPHLWRGRGQPHHRHLPETASPRPSPTTPRSRTGLHGGLHDEGSRATTASSAWTATPPMRATAARAPASRSPPCWSWPRPIGRGTGAGHQHPGDPAPRPPPMPTSSGIWGRYRRPAGTGRAGYNGALKAGLDVVLGGGSSSCPPPTRASGRDGRNLIDEMQGQGLPVCQQPDELNQAGPGKPLLGLFGSSP